jgi:hypothetical protein
MCDGVTQGAPGMELSLFSRDAIAMGTAIALSHDVFDAALMLGICDKIVPGLLIGALHFGHLPTVFVPAGPMTSGLSNGDKAKVREQAAQGLVGRKELLAAESAAYHGGTVHTELVMLTISPTHSVLLREGAPGVVAWDPNQAGDRTEGGRHGCHGVYPSSNPSGTSSSPIMALSSVSWW